MAPVSSKEFLDIQATIECRFTLKLVRDLIITYSICLYFYLVAFLHLFFQKKKKTTYLKKKKSFPPFSLKKNVPREPHLIYFSWGGLMFHSFVLKNRFRMKDAVNQTLRSRLCERKWLNFCSSECSKNDPGLKSYFFITWRKMYLVHKRTKSRLERAF